MNKQQIFDVVVHHAIKQHSKAMNVYERCQYHAEDGSQCFVGALIPKSAYHPDMESRGITYMIQVYPVLIPIVLPTNMEFNLAISFMETLQKIHDTSEVIFWGEKLRKFANDYGLKFINEK